LGVLGPNGFRMGQALVDPRRRFNQLPRPRPPNRTRPVAQTSKLTGRDAGESRPGAGAAMDVPSAELGEGREVPAGRGVTSTTVGMELGGLADRTGADTTGRAGAGATCRRGTDRAGMAAGLRPAG